MNPLNRQTDPPLPAAGRHQLPQPDLSGHLRDGSVEHGHEIQRAGPVFGQAEYTQIPLLLVFGLDVVLYSFPTADMLTFILTVTVIARVYREFGEGNGSGITMTEAEATA